MTDHETALRERVMHLIGVRMAAKCREDAKLVPDPGDKARMPLPPSELLELLTLALHCSRRGSRSAVISRDVRPAARKAALSLLKECEHLEIVLTLKTDADAQQAA